MEEKISANILYEDECNITKVIEFDDDGNSLPVVEVE